jgi:hypothetical protein
MFNPNLEFLLVQKLKLASRALLSFLLFLAWTSIASLDIIDAYHLGLRCPCLYHYISYAFHVKVQCVLCIPVV